MAAPLDTKRRRCGISRPRNLRLAYRKSRHVHHDDGGTTQQEHTILFMSSVFTLTLGVWCKRAPPRRRRHKDDDAATTKSTQHRRRHIIFFCCNGAYVCAYVLRLPSAQTVFSTRAHLELISVPLYIRTRTSTSTMVFSSL